MTAQRRLSLALLILAIPIFLQAQYSPATTTLPPGAIPTPKEAFGFNIGDNYQLANYTQTEAYFKKLAAASDRVKLVVIGQTEEGRDQLMLIDRKSVV